MEFNTVTKYNKLKVNVTYLNNNHSFISQTIIKKNVTICCTYNMHQVLIQINHAYRSTLDLLLVVI